MKREIKFRGKDENGNWQYGTYYYGVMYPTSLAGHYINDVLVDENTIGEYTGLRDKKGIDIYEGDIVTGGKLQGQDRFSILNEKSTIHFESGIFKAGQISLCSINRSCDIIGNIYEHPNLITL